MNDAILPLFLLFNFSLVYLTLILKPRVESQTSKIKWKADQLINHLDEVIEDSSEGFEC